MTTTHSTSLAEILRHPMQHLGAWVSLAVIGIILAVTIGAFALLSGAVTPWRLTPQHIVDALEANAGVHPGYRRNHAKGVCVSGYFQANGAGLDVSRAQLFKPGRTPVIGRFAIPGGNPMAADASVPIRSMALVFDLPHAQQWRMGMNNTLVFAVNTPQGFYDQAVASRPEPATGKPDAALVAAFYAKHPETKALQEWMKHNPPSSGFGDGQYHGIVAFRAIAGNGKTSFIRWTMVPEDTPAPLTAAQTSRHDFLDEDLRQRLAGGPLRWQMVITVAEPGDPTHDATLAWPQNRRHIQAGTLVIERESAEGADNCRDINFDPTVVPDGIALSDDPLLAARSSAYAVSYERRTREIATGQAQPRSAP